MPEQKAHKHTSYQYHYNKINLKQKKPHSRFKATQTQPTITSNSSSPKTNKAGKSFINLCRCGLKPDTPYIGKDTL